MSGKRYEDKVKTNNNLRRALERKLKKLKQESKNDPNNLLLKEKINKLEVLLGKKKKKNESGEEEEELSLLASLRNKFISKSNRAPIGVKPKIL
jgi:hypothetical protein